LNDVLKLALKAEFGPEFRTRLGPDFMAEVWSVLIAVLKRRLRSVLNTDLRAEFTPEVTPLLITQVPT
jgi:hypothetical protein